MPATLTRKKQPPFAARSRHVGLAQERPTFDQRIEHRLQSKAERLITLSTSAVAVCCSSDRQFVVRAQSSNSRTFSIAITAWSAKVVTSSICFSVNGPDLGAAMVPIGSLSLSISGTARTARAAY